ncbi:PAS domain-containing protein [Opitutus terrae]|uniref:histidine kinase n=1 Tax=Opitutus terrae (strain DSM 11246 / JCM 15787 / PB90-1) TaxID=452637 RepID=B1ZWY4_OPITP|nr:PAS domain-containing protein [Opitutus terrae]ACB75095.1 multi-sensor hybrid histidine kinase [Opitutus terrae PB90-1]
MPAVYDVEPRHSHALTGIFEGRLNLSGPVRYATAVLAVAAGWLVRAGLMQAWGDRLPYLTLYPAVMIAAILGGFGPGVLATALSVLVVAISWTRSGNVFYGDRLDWVGMAAFAGCCLGIAGLAALLHRSRRRRDAQHRALETAHAQLEELERQHARAEARLRESEERFRLTAASDGITLYEQDANLRYVWLYPQHAEHGAALGRTDGELLPNAEGERLMQRKQEVLTQGTSCRVEVRAQLPAGTKYYDTFIAPRRDASGRIVGVAGTALDVTDRRQREQSRQLLAAIVESSEDAIIALDLEGTITSWNQGSTRLFGYTAAETIGHSVTMLIPRERFHEEPQILERIRAGERIEHYETRRRRKDGTELEISLSVSPLRDDRGEIVGASKIARDVTLRNRTERNRRFIAMLNERLASSDQPDEIVQTASRLVAQFLGAQDCCFSEWHDETGAALVHYEWGEPGRPAGTGVHRLCEFAPAEWRRQFPHEFRIADITREAPDAALVGKCQAAGVGSFATAGVTRKAPWIASIIVASQQPRTWRDDEMRLLKAVVARVWPLVERARSETALRTSEEQLRLITDHAPVSLAQVDRERRLKFVNQTYARRFGREPHDLIGQPLKEVVGATAYARIQPHLDGAFAGRHVEFETEIALPVGGTRWVHAVHTPETAPDGTVIGVIVLITDITARKEAERQVALARDQALAAARAKDDFLAALSHELRTPLNPVLLIASDAAENPALAAEVRRDFATIRKNVELEARLIDDLLDVTRITHGKLPLDLRPVSAEQILQDALSVIRPDAEQKRITLVTELTAHRTTVRGDAVRLQQVFWNVLKNAVKFTPAGGRITVTSANLRGGDTLRVAVRDNGIGMTPAEIARVFDAFTQGDHAVGSNSHRFGGLGLGLTISRLLVEQHHGDIRAESAGPGQGATFTIELPVTTQPIATVGSTTGDDGLRAIHLDGRAGRRRGRVLLVEDHAPTRDALASLLRRRNYEVLTAATIGEARAHLAAGGIGLLVSDIGLPDGDGCDLMAELRGRAELRGIALTGYGMDADIARSTKAGFFAHLTKPIRVQALDAVLAAIDSPAADFAR